MDNKKHLSEKMRYKDALPVSIYTMQKWIKEAKALEAEVEGLKAICENVGELLSTMEDAHLQTAWHILDNAGFTKNHKKAPPGE